MERGRPKKKGKEKGKEVRETLKEIKRGRGNKEWKERKREKGRKNIGKE